MVNISCLYKRVVNCNVLKSAENDVLIKSFSIQFEFCCLRLLLFWKSNLDLLKHRSNLNTFQVSGFISNLVLRQFLRSHLDLLKYRSNLYTFKGSDATSIFPERSEQIIPRRCWKGSFHFGLGRLWIRLWQGEQTLIRF